MEEDLTLTQLFDRLCVALDAAGFPVVLRPGKGTSTESWTRFVIAYYLHRHGAIDAVIAEMLNRDRSTITSGRIRVEVAVTRPEQYRTFRIIHDTLKTKYHDIFGTDI